MWPALILSSPFTRALETAQVAAKALGYEDEIVTSNALIPEATPEDAWDEIKAHRDQSEVLVASHQPLCGALAAFLLNAPTLELDFRKSALVCIDVDGGSGRPKGTLQWMLTAKLA